ncbi:MAG: radical SAM protein [Gammaproteobacteria bacterium]|nr:radical SAM protein [Gammaproteobacteria bacterium]
MRLTLIHPCVGRWAGDKSYIRSWQMEPLAPAVLAGLTPPDVAVRFYDDRLETIPFDAPTDLVAISVETYTARRAYQIATEYRQRGVKVVLGGFHTTLCPDEASLYADAIVVGEAEGHWANVIDDARHGTLQDVYRSPARPPLSQTRLNRDIFRGKRYVPVTLIEAGRGCHFRCEFCAVQSYFGATQNRRPIDDILREVAETRSRRNFYFFVDDNITSNFDEGKELYRQLSRYNIRWVSQASINAAHDEEFLDLISRSGCQGLLIGFESLDRKTLHMMKKKFNTMGGGYENALANLRKYHIRLYSTFVFGYDRDTRETFDNAVAFANEHRFYMAAFNHLTPFPGTPLYDRLKADGKLIYDAWWMDPAYAYNKIPFRPKLLTPEQLQQYCIDARAKFYSIPGILRRFADPVNRSNAFMARNFPLINFMMRREVHQRDDMPLGDQGWHGELRTAYTHY